MNKLYAEITVNAPNEISSRINYLLEEIKKIKIGKETIKAINSCGHKVAINHQTSARISAGQTGAPATRNLTNGKGEDVYINFDGTIPNKGSHYTYDLEGKKLAFSAVQNLFHELSHARHMTCGTWLYADSEGQAIRDENIFRKQEALKNNSKPARFRYDIIGCSYDEDETECLEFFEDDD